MLCKNCGKEILDDAQICPECGTDLTAPETEQKEDAVISEQPVADAPETTTNNENAAGSEDIVSKLLGFVKGHKKVLIGIGAALLALILVCNLSNIAGFFVKAFGSEADYFRYVEEKALDDYTETLTNTYGTYLDILDCNYGYEMDVELELGKEALSLIEDSTDMDMKWLNDIAVAFAANMKNDMAQANVIFEIDGKEIIDADAIVDIKNGDIFLALLNLSDKYLTISDMMPTDENAAMGAAVSTEMITKIVDKLPSEKKMNKLINKYLKIALDQIEDVSESKETLKIGDIEEKVTALKFKCKEKTVLNMGIAVLEELSNDKDVKNIIEDVAAVLADEGLIESTDGIYDSFLGGIDMALTELEDMKDGELSKDNMLVLTDYVNSKHEIVGRSIKVGEEEVLSYATAHKGSKFEFEFKAGELKLTGAGKDKSGKIDGEFKLSADGKKMLDIVVSDFDTDKIKDGKISGTFKVDPTANMYSELMGNDSGMLAALNLEFEFIIDADNESGEIEVNLIENDELFVGVVLTYDSGNGDKVSAPSDKDQVEMEEFDEWVASLDFEKIIKALEKADVDKDIIEYVEDFIDNIEGQF